MQDAFNPPPRYLIESDSEDELGGGVYGTPSPSTLKKPEKQEHIVAASGQISPNAHVTVCVGLAGAALRARLAGDIAGTPITVDDVEVSALYAEAAQS